jgi:Fms-interacting protein/Thoc5
VPQYKRAAVATIKLKHFNREIQQALEQKRNEVEKEKEVVEMLKLKLENVLYKKAYLQREIRVLKDFTTPELNAVEKEIGRPLAAVDFSAGTLASIETAAKEVMQREIIDREETFKKLELLTTIKAGKEEVLDKKRKFLDDIPLRMNLVKASTADIKAQFDAYKNGLNSAEDDGDVTAVDAEDDGVENEGEGDDDGAMKEEGEEDFETSNDAMDESNPAN